MLDLRWLREMPQQAKDACQLRGMPHDNEIDALLLADAERRTLLSCAEGLRTQQNELCRGLYSEKGQPDGAAQRDGLRKLAAEIQEIETRQAKAEKQLQTMLLSLPNRLADDLPAERTVLEVKGEPKRFPYEPRAAKGLLSDRGLCRGRPPVLFGVGARLEHAVAAYFFERLQEAGFFEFSSACLDGEALFFPYRGTLFDQKQFPLGCCAYRAWEAQPLFNWQVGSGAIEMLCLLPPDAKNTLTDLCNVLSEALLALELSFRWTSVPATELPFEAMRAVLLELWMPAAGKYRPLGVFSAHGDFLARRFACRCKMSGEAKPRPVTSVGGALPLAGVVSALLEHGQNGDGSVDIPTLLRPMTGLWRITR